MDQRGMLLIFCSCKLAVLLEIIVLCILMPSNVLSVIVSK